ncbi:P-loop containing nucleoside triphosphate hydrolase protein [Panaeolus papilionaceus]|nr:P-loop containing nucleoside triphosphate hydrolase protein [Panaeolus papilionaceus]
MCSCTKSTSTKTIMVSPLLALQNEQALTFTEEFGLSAVAVNSSFGGCTPEVLEALKAGHYQILVISPELLLSKTFVDDMLRKSAFTSRVFAVVVDEAHVVSHWGSGFRKKYGELGMIRAFLPRGTPIVAMSATLPDRLRSDVLKKLEYPKESDFLFVNIGNDRPNVALVVRALEHSQDSYRDLDFIITARTINGADDIPLTMLYADSVTKGPEIIDYLCTLLPSHLRNAGLIRPFSAGFHLEYRSMVLALFKSGRVRVLVCTDAAGMGCNLPAVEVVVQWKLPQTLSSFVQRAGRAARTSTMSGLAVLLAERTIYGGDQDTPSVSTNADSESTKKKDLRTKKEIGDFAISNGILRGSYKGIKDEIIDGGKEVEPNPDATDEGLRALVQTTKCRRRVTTKAYRNVISDTPLLCCDICNPTLLDRTRPGPPVAKPRQTTVKKLPICDPLKWALYEWRTDTHQRDFPNAMHGPSALLPDSLISTLSSMGPVTDESLKRVLKNQFPRLHIP